jgi:hypothetical protein
MKKHIKTFVLFLLLAHRAFASVNDVYLIIYATHDGKTGHAGIAVDKYEVKVYDCRTCPQKVRYDTVKTGALLYFDVWPEDDRFGKDRVFDAVKAEYFRLPASSAETPITVYSLTQKGIPHKEGYACDGLLQLQSSRQQDYDLAQYLDVLCAQNKNFDAIEFNCADFAELALERLTGKDIQADESVVMNWTTTPNKLWQAAKKLPDAAVLKDPGKLTDGSFFEEKILKWK